MRSTIAMQQGAAGGGTNAELSQRIDEMVRREVDQAVAQSEAAAAAAAASQGGAHVVRITPEGTIIRTEDGRELVVQTEEFVPPWLQDGPPEGVFMIPIAMFVSIAFVIVGLPIARAVARRMDAKNATQGAVAPSAELRQIQNSIDTMAIEIERMSEHQRFLTRVLSEGSPAGSAPAHDASRAVPH